MRLTLDTAIRYLIDHDLVSSMEVIEAKLRLEDLSSRNRVMRIRRETRGTQGLLLKQATTDGRGPTSLEHELRVLTTIARTEALRGLRPYVPASVHVDRDEQILITELIDPATTLTKVWINGGRMAFPTWRAEDLARTTAAVHTGGWRRAGAHALRGVLPETLPYNLKADQNYGCGFDMASFGPATREAIALTRQDGRLASHATAVAQTWQSREPIHNDLRFDNVIFTTGGRRDHRLIDWELAIQGEGEWDVACFLADFVRLWGTNLSNGARVQHVPAEGRWALDPSFAVPTLWQDVRVAAAAYWRAYVRARRWGPARAAQSWARVAEFLPMAYIRVAIESGRMATSPPPAARLALDHLWRSLDNPLSAASEAFGISEVGA